MAKLIHLICLLSLISYIVSYDNPSLVYVLNEAQLKELEKIAIEKFLLNKELQIQDFHLKQRIDFIGTIQLDIIKQKFKFVHLTTDSMNIEFNDTNQLIFTLKDSKAELTFDYNFESNFYSNKGNGIISFSNALIRLKNKLTSVKNTLEPEKMGPCFEMMSLYLESVDMDIKFNNEGSLEKIIKGIILNLKDAFIETIQKKFNTDYINEINDILRTSLSKMKLSFPVAPFGLIISYSMHDLPAIQNKLLTSAYNVEIYDANYKYEGKADNLPPINDTISSVDILLNQFIFENYLYIMYKQNRLNWYIKSEATKDFPMTVNLFSECFPKIQEIYKNNEPIDLNIVQIATPQVLFTEKQTKGQTNIILNSNIEFIVRKDKKAEIAVAGNTTIDIEFEFELKDGKFSCTLTILEFKSFTTTKTIIGEVKPEEFLNGIKEITEPLIEIINPLINSLLDKIVIPSFLGIKFDHSSISIHNSFLQIGINPYITNSKFYLFE